MPKGKLSPEGEVIAAYGAAIVAAFQVLINCLYQFPILVLAHDDETSEIRVSNRQN